MAIPAHLIAHLPYFAAVAKYQSFTLAAESLFVSQAAVSYQIRQLEMKLDVLLVVRHSGSRVYLTHAGLQLAAEYQTCEVRLEHVLQSLQPQTLTGTLRLTAPVDFASKVLPYVLRELQTQAPHLKIDLDVSDAVVDLIADGFDFAIRTVTYAERLQHELFAQAHKSVVASPTYLAQYSAPQNLSDLKSHQILVRGLGQYFSWNQLLASEGLSLTTDYRTLVLGNTFALEEGAKAGLGLALLVDFAIQESLQTGQLVRVLPQFIEALTTSLYLSYLPSPQAEVFKQVLQQAIDTVIKQRFRNAFNV
ncbi:LysR family transcriptional regulator [uncultured Thiothrix sp.]|uniref:LysR family transcriptional regulator n=1 Tax=uncultured Thiothrix sp. TaxID=223185 RepID=UPI00260FDA9C|nr:LysR family transcriptional regulator [uncultured Thiothrix sp.]